MIFHTEMEKCADRAEHITLILFLGFFYANFCLFMRFLVLIFLRQKVHRCYNIYGWYISVSISIFHAYFEFEDKVPQYAKLIVFDETGMWSKVTMRGSAKGLVSHWSDRQN